MEKVRQRPLRLDFAQDPSLRKLTKTLGKFKNSKAGGSSNILPDMVKVACDDVGFRERLLDFTRTV